MKPSNCLKYPYDSVLPHNETETVARNIMVILSRTGDTFRLLEWEEYKEHRLKDGNFTESEKSYFDKVSSWCSNEANARSFSPAWSK